MSLIIWLTRRWTNNIFYFIKVTQQQKKKRKEKLRQVSATESPSIILQWGSASTDHLVS